MKTYELQTTPLQEALDQLKAALHAAGFTAGEESVPVAQAAHRITAHPVTAVRNVPHYAASAMDGFATRAELVQGASKAEPVTLSAGQYKQVDTGDPIPESCDTVVMIEHAAPGEDGRVQILRAAAKGQDIRPVGEDIKAGECLLDAYNEISPAAVGAMIAGGLSEVSVLKKPVIGFIPTGDEIISPDQAPEPGEIVDTNSSVFAAMLDDWQADVHLYPITPDKEEQLQEVLDQALAECDCVLLGAGSSAGRDDYAAEIIGRAGTVLTHGLATKPGKPTILAHRGKQPIIGLPGYPVAGIIMLREIVKPLIDMWYHASSEPSAAGEIAASRMICQAELGKSITSKESREEFVRVCISRYDDKLTATPMAAGSGSLSSYMKADGILRISVGCTGYEAGDTVEIELL